MKTIPNYHPPQDYRRPTKTQEKVYVPVNDYPEINFSMIANPLTLTNVSAPPVLVSPVWSLASIAATLRRRFEITDPSSKWALTFFLCVALFPT